MYFQSKEFPLLSISIWKGYLFEDFDVCVCVCVCIRESGEGREGEREKVKCE